MKTVSPPIGSGLLARLLLRKSPDLDEAELPVAEGLVDFVGDRSRLVVVVDFAWLTKRVDLTAVADAMLGESLEERDPTGAQALRTFLGEVEKIAEALDEPAADGAAT